MRLHELHLLLLHLLHEIERLGHLLHVLHGHVRLPLHHRHGLLVDRTQERLIHGSCCGCRRGLDVVGPWRVILRRYF